MKILGKYLKRHLISAIFSTILVVLMVSAQLWQPNLLKDIINEIAQNNTDKIFSIGLQLLIIALIGLVAGIINTFIAAKIAQNIGADLRKDIFSKVQEFSFNTIEKFSASNLVVRMTNDTAQVQNLIMMLLQSLMRIPLMFVISFTLAITVLPELWWVIILLIVVVLLVMGVAFGMMGPRFGRLQKLIEQVNTSAKENFLGIRVVKSFVQEHDEIEKFTDVSARLAKETITIGIIFSVILPFVMIIGDGSVSLSLYLAGGMVDANPAIISEIVAFTSYLSRIMMAIIIGGTLMSFSTRAFVSLKRIQEVLDQKTDLTFGNDGANITQGDLVVDNVSFRYEDGNEDMLENLSFTVPAGQTVGIIGATGSGKTTLAQLIARIYDPTEGNITLDGRPLISLTQANLRKAVSIVLQRPILFSGTVGDNIRQGHQTATEDELEKAAHIAQAAEFIDRLPGKFDSEIYQRGANFSGGQKQRISIARGVVGNPKVLILDDSTSALDARSEKKVKEAIAEQLSHTTKVIISQKISSIVHADKIIVLDAGKMVGEGKHSELLQTCAVYKEIYDTQKDQGGQH